MGSRPAALVGAIALLAGAPAWAQNQPQSVLPVATVDGSGTIAASGVFQQVFAAASQSSAFPSLKVRSGCLVVNTSASVMYVFFGPIANATTPTGIPLNPATSAGLRGGSATCVEGTVGVVQEQVSVSGTAGSTFTAKQE